MTWASGQSFEFYTTPQLQVLEGDSWRDLLTVPAADLKASHAYAVVITGNHGNYVSGQGFGIVNAGAILAEYNGTYVADTLHRFDLAFGEMTWPAQPIYSQPFTILATFSCGVTPADFVVRGRCEDTGASPRASFYLEGLAVQVYDLTALTSAQYLATATTGTLADYFTGTLSPLLNLTSDLAHNATTPKKWLLWYSIVLQAETDVLAGSWMTTNTATPKAFHVFANRTQVNCPGSWIGTRSRGRTGYWHRHHVGSGRVLEVDATGVRPTLWAADLWTTPNPTKPLAAKILAIPLDGIADEVHHDYTAAFVGGAGAWAPSDNPDWKQSGIETTYRDTLRALAVARGSFTSPQAFACSFYSALEIDSERLSPGPFGSMRTKVRSVNEVQAMHRVGSFEADSGRHCLRHVLWCDTTEPASLGTDLTDHQLLVLSTAPGFGLSKPPADLIGPEVVLVPGKESVDVGSLPSLPIEPNVPPSWDELDPAFELKTPTGYSITWPMALEPRRRGELRWTGIEEADKETLVAWLRARSDAGAAFAFTPPDQSAALPFVLDGSSFRWAHQAAGKYEVQIGAVELRYTGA